MNVQSGFNVLLVCEDKASTEELEQSLTESGMNAIDKISVNDSVLHALSDNEIDLIVLDLKKPTAALFEQISLVSEYCPKPVVCFSNDADSHLITKSVKAGVTAYIVDGKESHRIKPIIDVAIVRFKESQAIKKELAQVKDKLSERGVIEKAKGLLIENKQMSEDQAYQTMRKMAMDQGKKISVVAHEICGVLTGLSN